MDIRKAEQDGVTIVSMGGRLDAAGSPEVEAFCRGLMDAGEVRQLLDMTEVEYISSAGLRSLLVVAKQIKAAGGVLVLCSLAPMVREVMEISGFDKILVLAADRDAARAQFEN